jgi:hypothetical protein
MNASRQPKNPAVKGILLIIVVSVFCVLTWKIGYPRWENYLITIMLILFFQVLFKSASSEKISWEYFNMQDKFVYFISLTLCLIFPTYAAKEGLSFLTLMVATLFGLALFNLILYLGGSEVAKTKYFGWITKQKRSTP